MVSNIKTDNKVYNNNKTSFSFYKRVKNLLIQFLFSWKESTESSLPLPCKKCLWPSRCNAKLKSSGNEVSFHNYSGQKVAQSGRVPFRNCTANFDKQLTISCNMVLDTKTKKFQQKQTKFAIVIYTEKGNKQAGQVIFDVAPFLNQKSQSKSYELGLNKCPDKNAKICFSLKATTIEEKSFDTISQGSMASVDIQVLANKNREDEDLSSSAMKSSKSSSNGKPTFEVLSLPQENRQRNMVKSKEKRVELAKTTQRPSGFSKQHATQKAATQRHQVSAEAIKQLESENKKMREQLKKKQQLKKENQELKRKLKDDDYDSCKDFKKKIEQGKKEIEQLNQESKGSKKLSDDIKKLEKQILKCKEHIMKVFNDAQKLGPEVMDKIQEACGFKEY